MVGWAVLQNILSPPEAKETAGFLFFWGDESPFSNWYPIGDYSNTSEHFFMTKKAEFFGDFEAVASIKAANHPRLAKKIGRQIKKFDQKLWDKAKLAAMIQALMWKWGQCEQFRRALLESGKLTIVEASPYDRIWGIGFTEQNALIPANRANWGENLLGKSLMITRSIYNGTGTD